MVDSASRESPSRTLRARSSPTPVDGLQVVDAGGQQLLQGAEVVDQAVDDGAGQPRHLGQQAVAAGRHGAVEVLGGCRGRAPGPPRRGRAARWARAPRAGRALLGAAAAATGGQVVADDELALGVDAGDQLLELQGQQAPVGAELEHVVLDLAGDPGHHLESLGHDGDVADGDEVLDLQRREGARPPRRGAACSARAWPAPGWRGRGSGRSPRGRGGSPRRTPR